MTAGAALGLAVVGVESLRPHANASVAVVFPPWVDADTAVDRVAGAGAVGSHASRYPFVALVPDSSPSFRTRVRREGALLVLDAGMFGGLLGKDGVAL